MYVYILCFNYIQKYKKPNRIGNYKKKLKIFEGLSQN